MTQTKTHEMTGEVVKVWAIGPKGIQEFLDTYYSESGLEGVDPKSAEMIKSRSLQLLCNQVLRKGWCHLDGFKNKLGVLIGFKFPRKFLLEAAK